MEKMGSRGRLNSKPPARHLPQTSNTGANTKSALPSELDCDEPKRLITRWNQSKFCTAEDKWRQSCKFWFGENSAWIFLHHDIEFECCEFAVKINDGSNGEPIYELAYTIEM